MISTDVKLGTFIDYGVESIMTKDPIFKVGYRVRISKYKNYFENYFEKGHITDWLEEVFVIKKVKKHCTMDIRYK